MGYRKSFILLLIASLSVLSTAKPIMVTFGTNNGSITPQDTSLLTSTIRPSNANFSKVPAPIYEITDDIPNPNIYRPAVPWQYRSKVHSFVPKWNKIQNGQFEERKYIPSPEKFNLYRKQQAKSVGVGYTGPNLFEAQPYEFESQKIQPTVKTRPQVLFQPAAPAPKLPVQQGNGSNNENNNNNNNTKYVPQIGILYSGGLRYYIPQINYDYQQETNDIENSVYDKDDQKHVYYRQERSY